VKKLLTKGSMILRFKGLYLKVTTITPAGGNEYVFDCMELESRHPMVLSVSLLGLHDALDKAARARTRSLRSFQTDEVKLSLNYLIRLRAPFNKG
jgi:hypothetical protein